MKRSRRDFPAVPRKISFTTRSTTRRPSAINGHEVVKKSVLLSSMRVGSGSLAPRPRYIVANLGSTNTDITTIAATATHITIVG